MRKKDISHLEEIGKFTSLSFAGEIARYIFLIISSAIVTNVFGAKIFGQYIYIMSFITIVITLSKLGMGKTVLFYIPKFMENGLHRKLKATISFSYIVVAISSGLLTVLIMIFSKPIAVNVLNSPDSGRLVLVLAPLVFIEALYNQTLAVFKGMKRIGRVSLIRNIYYHLIRIFALVICFFVFGVRDVYGIVIPTYAAYIFVLSYSAHYQMKNSFIDAPGALSSNEKRELMKYSLPLFMTSILYVLLRQVDILMIGFIKDSTQVAIYNIAIQICAIIPFFGQITNLFLGPVISSLHHSGKKKEIASTYQTITKWTFTVGLFIFIALFLFGESILHIFGKDFIGGDTALILVACGALIGVIIGPAGTMNAMTGHPGFNLITSIITFTINIILNIFLIPKHGINGAAFATLVAAFIGNTLSLFFLYRKQRIQPYNIKFLKPLVAGASSYLVISLINNYIYWKGITDVIIKGGIYTIIFMSIVWLLRIDEDDKIIIKHFLKGFGSIAKKLKQ